jgi:hypothetical protein
MSVECAAPGCDKPVERHPGQTGRPPIYCSPACRPSHTRPTLTIEVDHDGHQHTEPGREWLVRLRRGQHSIVLRDGLGRFSAAAFATELRSLLPANIDETTP